VRVHLIGPEAELRDLLDEHLENEDLPIVIHHASERIGMEEKAAHAVRTKKDSSMRVGLKLVREGKAAGFVTAGNTGAAMATAKMVLGALPGVDRPALATPMPSSTGNPCVLLDVGANVDCKAHNLAQFAVMGEMYARTVLKIDEPRVGLLSIGEEETKGNDLTREAFPLLKALPIKFIGNVEGRDIFSGLADVIVCDGFVGNVALKTSEGVGRFVRDVLRESLTRTVTAQVGALLSRRAFNDFRRRLDYREYGGAPLLGVRGVCIIGHGSSNDRAIFNGIRVAYEFAKAGPRQGQPHQRADNAAGERDDDGLGQELELDLAVGGAHGLADADLADAGAHIGQHDVHDAHAAHRQGDGGHQHQDRGQRVGDLGGHGEQFREGLRLVNRVGPMARLMMRLISLAASGTSSMLRMEK
jgi:glycerol-3-phosphate acyltransferase PlsX